LTLIEIALNFPFPLPFVPLPPANLDLLGHHYFSNLTTPVFNLDIPQQEDGIAITKKVAQMNAPVGSIPGQHNSGDGAVAWLFLSTIDGTTGNYGSVYRVNTAGGQPPTTCNDMSGTFMVPYSAAYYFYGS
jgi:hypothetical protein